MLQADIAFVKFIIWCLRFELAIGDKLSRSAKESLRNDISKHEATLHRLEIEQLGMET